MRCVSARRARSEPRLSGVTPGRAGAVVREKKVYDVRVRQPVQRAVSGVFEGRGSVRRRVR